MFKKKKINILKNLFKKKIYIKYEIKKIVLKSIINNNNVSLKKKKFIGYKLSKMSLNTFLSKQKNNHCIKTGKFKSVLKITNFSRHYTKELFKNNTLQNFKITGF